MRPNVIFNKLNAELFQFLAKSLPNRTSRFDAFLYLYERQAGHFDALLKYGFNIPFGTTYNQLAKRWGWDRKTVMSFLKSLHKEPTEKVQYVNLINDCTLGRDIGESQFVTYY